ncbi:MAG: DUF2304 domain-containing protein [Acidimicrobiia bacterium]
MAHAVQAARHMSARAQVLVVGVAAVGFLVIVILVRRGSLKERFAVLWLGIAAGMLLLAAVRPWLDRLTNFLGIRSGTTTLFFFSILFLLGLILHLSMVVSDLEEKQRRLAEAIALLDAHAERTVSGADPPVPSPRR